jgi:hypothetical protein
MATNLSDPLGVDLAVSDDLDPHFRLCHGNENLSLALCRRLSSPSGCLESIGDDPNYGYDLPGQLNTEETDPKDLSIINGSARAEMLKDPRVQDVSPQTIAVTD